MPQGMVHFSEKTLLHGGDYNPEQWLDRPEILEQDLQILQKTGCNTVTLGVFSWSMLEPSEGEYRLDWLAEIVDRMYAHGIHVILATPSGARPKWMAQRYPQVLRVDERGQRAHFGFRHNHCPTSPVYREKTARINAQLARRLGRHPGVILWHISNELGGACYCPLCQEAFRSWLKERYGSIRELNQAWWTTFWSHTYPDFDSIEAPSVIGESSLHALNLEWRRFVTEQTADFVRNEMRPLRQYSDRPVTTNLMYYFEGLDYFRLARELDLVSWDSYPTWHKDALLETARDNALWHDLMRSLKGAPFLLMESCPSSTNWQGVSKLKKPGLLQAQSLQAIAHGADGALYFQIRQSRGGPEKFHGALIDHYGGADTRVLAEAAKTGEALAKLSCLTGAHTRAQVAILYDWSNLWALSDSQGPRNDGLHFKDLLLHCYHACRENALDVDFVDEETAADRLCDYRILILPMGYQFRDGFAEKVRAFAAQGGIVIGTFVTGVTDGTDLCYLGGVPYGLMDVFGLRVQEVDGLYDHEENALLRNLSGEEAGEEFRDRYSCRYLCELLALQGAEAVFSYASDFYEGTPAVTRHCYGMGEAWYIASFAERSFFVDLLRHILSRQHIPSLVAGPLPEGLEVTSRVGKIRKDAAGAAEAEDITYLIFQNFGTAPAAIPLPLPGYSYEDILGSHRHPLQVYETVVVAQKPM